MRSIKQKNSDIFEKNRKYLALCIDTVYSPPLERWPSGRRRSPAKGVGLKRFSRVRISSSPPFSIQSIGDIKVKGFLFLPFPGLFFMYSYFFTVLLILLFNLFEYRMVSYYLQSSQKAFSFMKLSFLH